MYVISMAKDFSVMEFKEDAKKDEIVATNIEKGEDEWNIKVTHSGHKDLPKSQGVAY